MKGTAEIDKIINSLKDKDILGDSVYNQNLEIIRHNLIVISASKRQVAKDAKDKGLEYGFHIINGCVCSHPGIKMIEASEKAIMSCFRQLDIKPEVSKKKDNKSVLRKMMDG